MFFLIYYVASTHDKDVFSFYPNERYCNGFEEVLTRYREMVPHLRLAGKIVSYGSFLLSLYSFLMILALIIVPHFWQDPPPLLL